MSKDLPITLGKPAGDGTLTISLAGDGSTLAKAKHDLDGALRSLNLAIGGIKKGYRFADEQAEAKIKAMERSLDILKRELGLLQQIYDALS